MITNEDGRHNQNYEAPKEIRKDEWTRAPCFSSNYYKR